MKNGHRVPMFDISNIPFYIAMVKKIWFTKNVELLLQMGLESTMSFKVQDSLCCSSLAPLATLVISPKLLTL